ncbi:lytic murein transglycosylase [Ancylobacter amanitiformis]|uniref:Lytic murein transglycosylase n=1 Tax=Ancylobacter amanitiformis TaxID=217069 RepID=A0ABU0LLA6_9HYPH|nr:lytic murein transglycosylase [Ancylobacter amanitiformis]MDQ0509486.1 lytic murein transglycosylase [Ancylobacter amanitiformis]
MIGHIVNRMKLAGRGAGLLAALLAPLAAGPALAAPCGNDAAGFDAWMRDFRQQAVSQGISPAALRPLDGVTYDTKVISLDRNQKHFKMSFEEFSRNRISKGRIAKGKQMLQRYASTLAQIERRYGVPGPILVAIWGMETDYGANIGNMPILRSLATLSYDCRRSGFFTPQLLDALRIYQRGDLTLDEMRGAWAGEIGQTQFLASSYVKFAVDFDGDGRADLVRSPTDVLASTANYLRGYGWRAGAGWGPGEPNYQALLGWNKAEVYARTLGVFAGMLTQ